MKVGVSGNNVLKVSWQTVPRKWPGIGTMPARPVLIEDEVKLLVDEERKPGRR